MASKGENEITNALQGVLDLYDIKLDSAEEGEEHPIDPAEVISKTQSRIDELNEQAEKIFQRTGMNREQLDVYASNPNNFSKEQWEALQKVREACENYKKEARAVIGEEEFDEKVHRKRKKRAPHRFAKKKHWLPM